MRSGLMGADAIKLCRLCANTIEATNVNDLFHKSNKFMLEQINELAGIRIKQMPRKLLPRFFCADCKEILPRACEFRRKIIDTQSYFQSVEYKNKLEAKKQQESSKKTSNTLEKNDAKEAKETKQFLVDFTSQEDSNTRTDEHTDTVIKDEIGEFTGESDDEKPIDSNELSFTKPKTRLKTSQANSCNTEITESQKFDAVFLPLKKEDSVLNKPMSEDDESEEDVLEDFTADESEDEDFIVKLDNKKKYDYKKKPPSNNPAKETPKDPRKNPLFCYLCNTTLKTSHAFKVHCRKLHKGEKIFKCDSCEETFLRIKSLIRHSRLHQGGKLFECRYCDMSFNAPTTRIHHERAKHTKDWPFLCPICGKSFITTTRGKEHMTVHTKERPYKCELCKTAYLQRNNFKKHRRSELHKNNEKKLKESMENQQNDASVNKDKNDTEEK